MCFSSPLFAITFFRFDRAFSIWKLSNSAAQSRGILYSEMEGGLAGHHIPGQCEDHCCG